MLILFTNFLAFTCLHSPRVTFDKKCVFSETFRKTFIDGNNISSSPTFVCALQFSAEAEAKDKQKHFSRISSYTWISQTRVKFPDSRKLFVMTSINALFCLHSQYGHINLPLRLFRSALATNCKSIHAKPPLGVIHLGEIPNRWN